MRRSSMLFSAPRSDETHYIPYNVADQSARQTSRVIDGFFALLDLKDSRFGALRILSLLELPGIKERFGLTSSDIEMLEGWVRELNIRWGIDAGSRSKIGLPGFPENTWKAGIERLLLGVAMPGDADHMFAGILPYDPVEGRDTQVLGKFLEFLDQVFYWSGALGPARSAGGWQALLVQLLEQFFFVDESTERQIQLIRQTLDSFGRMEDLAQYDRSIELEVVRTHLERLLEQTTYGTGFISGGVTFCAMLPMRSIPFKTVCLIGMDNDAYPREQKQPEFDLISRYPRSGDRSRRKDDRYLFLEALVSARQKLYISYVGQSIQDNTGIPPSVLVSELIDYLQQGFGLSEDDLVIRHPLQAYSPRYFSKEEPQLYSYSKENCIAVAKMNQREMPTAFIASPLSAPAQEWKNMSIEQLGLFFSNPVKFLLQHRLGLRFEGRGPVSEDKENFSLDTLQRYQINQQLAQNRRSGVDSADGYRIQQARGNLPLGNVGQVVYNDLDLATEAFISGVEAFTRGQNPGRKVVDLNIADFNLQGMLTDLYQQGRIQVRYAALKPRDMLTAWINHLILCAQNEIFCPAETILIGTDAAVQFETVDDPLKILQDLLMLYWQGLSMPLHFFPQSSYVYANIVLRKGKLRADAVKAAGNKWLGSDFSRGESEDPYYRQCFERMDPIDERFEHIAVKVFTPLFEHSEKLVM
jgi:exodeoxyribonuclease V gamma subunit